MQYSLIERAEPVSMLTVDKPIVYAEVITNQSAQRNFTLKTETSLHAYFLLLGDTAEQRIEIITEQLEPSSHVEITIIQQAIHEHRSTIRYTSKQQGTETHNSFKLQSLIGDQASVSFTGMMQVGKQASQTQADQTSNFLLWGPQARAYTTPALEIERHDVSCTHGTTISAIEEAQLWYAASRGLDYNQTRTLIKNYFLYEFFEKDCTDAPVRDYMRQYMVKNFKG